MTRPDVLGPATAPDSGLLHRDVRHVTLVQVGGLGDLVHALPVADAIRQARPGVRLTWVTHPVPGQLLNGHWAADQLVTIPREGLLDGLLELRNRLKSDPADLTLNMRIYLKSLLPTLLSGAPIRVGLPKAIVRDGVWVAHTHHLPGDRWKHWQDHYLDFLPALGLRIPETLHWGLRLTRAEETEQHSFFGNRDRSPVVGLVVRTSLPAKDWPLERYPDLIGQLRARGYRVVLLGGPSGEEARDAAWILRQVGTELVLDGRADSVRELLWKIDGIDLMVSPDTGPLHLAHALGVPVIGLFGRSNPWRCGPWKRFHDLLIDRYTDPSEVPDPARSGPRSGRMESIRVEHVMEKVDLASRVYAVQRSTARGWSRRSPAIQ